jgi:putative oxidoreductase
MSKHLLFCNSILKGIQRMSNQSIAALAGRSLLALIFLVSGAMKIAFWAPSVGMMRSSGLPAPALLLGIAAAVELVAGLSLVTGIKARWAAALLAAFLVPVTLKFHNFWAYSGPQQQGQLMNFLKNLSIFGGLVVYAALAGKRQERAQAAGSSR